MGIAHKQEEHMEPVPSSGLKRSLSVWAAVGLSVALMAPSMAANINPQASAGTAGRAVPLTFLIAAVGVLLVAYCFVRFAAPGAEGRARGAHRLARRRRAKKKQ
jgi:amino acid transporter